MKETSVIQAKKAFEIEAECINEMHKRFDVESFSRAVELLRSAERIATCGCGHSGIMCQHLAHLLCCIELPARFIAPGDAPHGAMGFLKQNDVCVLVSRGGKTNELIPIMNMCKSKGVKIITITENLSSLLAKQADVVIEQYVNRETDKYNTQGTTSSTSLCVMFHALQAALIEETDYKNEQFATIHPGGAVGARLNNK